MSYQSIATRGKLNDPVFDIVHNIECIDKFPVAKLTDSLILLSIQCRNRLANIPKI